MKRRNLIKSIGLLGIAGTVGIFSSCKEEKEEEKVITKPEKDKKANFNRQKMSFKDPENPTKAELKHTPEIVVKETTGDFTRIEITVGSQGIIHPTTKEHWIDYIKLFLNNDLVGAIEFEAGMARGFGSFIVNTGSLNTLEFKAEIGCNLHGIWENTLTVNIDA